MLPYHSGWPLAFIDRSDTGLGIEEGATGFLVMELEGGGGDEENDGMDRFKNIVLLCY